ncbi:DegT/DnrJ/EryC1/StrS family aminotransferase [Streptomyces sp. HNM0574]|uniref:DegT/DnrJ/EryC1/StrS family aminotransferase n=1 Tax=Streptomyces sp. HNM0574 TaxID=2714954 RepID=UPI00146ADF0F|nr:DegT/DnrJ/EryC1/StrS family aminotransferase [Streptomyces sp. HNM0574]NLU65666.1 DegT/DnrJ/EryC1/StrS aminotransferase [Streptomyces sp. HNM0574]
MGTTQFIAAGVGAGDDVVLPAFGGEAAAVAVRELGARPVFADIDPWTYCIDPASVEDVLTERTVAVVALHLFGHPADLDGLRAVGGRHGAAVVEAEPLPQCATVDAVRRRQHAAYLDRRLTGVVKPEVAEGTQHGFSAYVVRVPGNGRPDRDAFKRALRARGVECYVPVKAPVHRLPGFSAGTRLPVAERAADETLALPVDASMSKRDLHRVVSACNALGGLLMEPAC